MSANVTDGIALNMLFQEAVTSGRRNHCSHCGQLGHNIQTCRFTGAAEERQRRAQARAQGRSSIVNGSGTPATPENGGLTLRLFKVYNDNTYPITVFWYHERDVSKKLHVLFQIPPYGHQSINANVYHNIVSFPTDELQKQFGTGRLDELPTDIKMVNFPQLFITGDTALSQLNPSTKEIIFFKEYQVAKTELEKWKECGLKALFLLNEIERLGGKRVDTLEPIIDMVQDIVVPVHDELDKERAGVPSVYTNIT